MQLLVTVAVVAVTNAVSGWSTMVVLTGRWSLLTRAVSLLGVVLVVAVVLFTVV